LYNHITTQEGSKWGQATFYPRDFRDNTLVDNLLKNSRLLKHLPQNVYMIYDCMILYESKKCYIALVLGA